MNYAFVNFISNHSFHWAHFKKIMMAFRESAVDAVPILMAFLNLQDFSLFIAVLSNGSDQTQKSVPHNDNFKLLSPPFDGGPRL